MHGEERGCCDNGILSAIGMRCARERYRALWIFAPSIIAFIIAIWVARVPIENTWEDVAYTIVSSAERAYQYGSRHFDAVAHTDLYDIDRAEYFYGEVMKLDPAHKYVRHQRARIAFLEGQFPAALALINAQIELFGTTTPSSHYVRGLVLGFMERYKEAASSFETYLEHYPNNWAAVNDYAWVLLKDGRSEDALAILEQLLNKKQENAWLLNSAAITAYEVGDLQKAREYIQRAHVLVQGVTRDMWLIAYPGNDPRVAEEGIAALRTSVEDNMHAIDEQKEINELQLL